MKNSHIAIINVPAPVHVNPTLSVVRTLVRRGYRVTYVTSQRFTSKISNLGAEVLLCPILEFPFNQNEQRDLPVENQYATSFTDLASRTLRLVSPFYEKNIPTMFLYDTLAFAGRVLAQRLRIPAISMTPQLAFSRDNLAEPLVPSEWRDYMLAHSRKSDGFFREHGIPLTDVELSAQEPAIYFYPKELQLNRVSDAASLYAARCAAERPDVEPWKTKGDGRPSIVISTSTTFCQDASYYEMCMRALASLNWHVVLAIGKNNDPASFSDLGPNSEIVSNVPLVAVMPRVDLMICLGGMTTITEAMYHGIPLVMLTHGIPEAEMYAENAQSAGLGLHLVKGATVGDIRNAVVRLSQDIAIRARVHEMQRVVKRSPGAEELVNWLEEHM